MKKIIVLVCVVLSGVFSNRALAQYKQGDKLLNLGIGLNSYYSSGLPLSVSYEYGFTPEISAGGIVDYVSSDYYNYRYTSFFFGGRGSYHFNKLLNINDRDWDVYGGASLGFRTFSWSSGFGNNTPGGTYASGLFLGIHAGVRYYFSPKVGAFGELGALGSSNIRLGVTFKL
ncbi:MAG: hypothetical protein JST43_06955 [Bacteroidetes bacterium]|nr:hypothetical protein [Bacteroidota bacterium]MBS1539692.1 hypothetical protein [Bacteroidota bacterium]